MTKHEFVKAISERSTLTQKQVAECLKIGEEVLLENISESPIKVFGATYTTTEHKARTCRNPRSGETVSVPAKRVPKIKASRALKAAVSF